MNKVETDVLHAKNSSFQMDKPNLDDINQLIELAEAEYNKILDEEENYLNDSIESNTDIEAAIDHGELSKLSERILQTKDDGPVEDHDLNEIFDLNSSCDKSLKQISDKKACKICQKTCSGSFDLQVHERIHHAEKRQ